jgi:hypothetical protein
MAANRGRFLLNWSAFVNQLELIAREQYGLRWNQARYVEKVAALTKSLDLGDQLLVSTRRAYRDVHPQYPEFQDLLHNMDVQVSARRGAI